MVFFWTFYLSKKMNQGLHKNILVFLGMFLFTVIVIKLIKNNIEKKGFHKNIKQHNFFFYIDNNKKCLSTKSPY